MLKWEQLKNRRYRGFFDGRIVQNLKLNHMVKLTQVKPASLPKPNLKS